MPIVGVIASSDRNVTSAPTIGTATNVGSGRAYNNGRADVTFTAPTYTGGSPITGYTVTSSPGGFTGTGASSPISVTGLQSGVGYTFTVTATNAQGTGPASAASNSITATTVPQAPTIGTATDGGTGTTVSVAFTGNATGGSAITGYTATSSPGSITGTGASSPITVSGLTAGTAYTFTVTATNANGTSTASAASNSVTPAVPTSFDSIATFTGNGTTNTYTFSSIPQTYKHLQVRVSALGTGGGALVMQINGDTGANYARHQLRGNGTTATAGGSAGNNTIQIHGSPGGIDTTAPMPSITDIIDYTSTSKIKVVRNLAGMNNNGTLDEGICFNSASWQNTSAITSLTIFSTGTVFSTGTSIALYGIRG